eukprot:3922607-Pyramimonas_sp.AAC.1
MTQSKCCSQNCLWHLSHVRGASAARHAKHLVTSDVAGLDRESSRWDIAPPTGRIRVANAETALLTALPC